MWPFRKKEKLTSEAQPLTKDQLEQVQAGYNSGNESEREAFQDEQASTIDSFDMSVRDRIARAKRANEYVEMGGPKDSGTLTKYLDGELTEEDLNKINTYAGTNIDGTRNAFTDEHIKDQEEVVSSFGKSNSR